MRMQAFDIKGKLFQDGDNFVDLEHHSGRSIIDVKGV